MTRLGIGNDLFDNVCSTRRILCPPHNAYDRRMKIKESIHLHYNAGDLILLALGPAATVLAADLAQDGIQALDIGHIDIEYSWYLMGAKKKVAIHHKYTNEVLNGRIEEDNFVDETYQKQIIDIIE